MKVRIGIGLGQTPLTAVDLAAVMAALDRHRLDSLWVSEVLTSPGPDVLVTLATAAQLHPRKRFGATLVLPGRNPVRLAKELASLDVLSGGRLLLTFVPGMATGAESEAVGVPVRDRGRQLDEVIPKLRRWWDGEEVDGVRVLPRTVQQPIEVWLAGIAPASLRRCGRLGDGWLGAACSVTEAAAARDAINAAAAEAGREVDRGHFGMSIGYTHVPPTDEQLAAVAARTRGRDVDPREVLPVGLGEVRTLIERHVERGLTKFVVRPPAGTTDWDAELAAITDAVGDLQT